MIGRWYCLQVDSSWMHIWIDASPVTHATVASGIDELHAHRRGQAEAHRAEAARVDPAARLVELVVLRGPHLVLADVGRDERVALGELVELLDHVLRLDELALGVVLQAILALPLLDVAPPRLERRGIGTLRRRLDDLDHLVEHVGDVAHDRHVDLHALADRRRVDVDVDDLAVAAEEVRRVADHAVVEARADRDAARRSAASPCSTRTCRACRACR